MPDQTLHTEMCSCASTTVVRIHSSGSYCGDTQLERLADALAPLLDRDIKELGEPDVESAASAVLDALRKEPAPAAIGLRKELEWLRDKLTSMVDAATEYSWVRVADQMEAAAKPSSVDDGTAERVARAWYEDEMAERFKRPMPWRSPLMRIAREKMIARAKVVLAATLPNTTEEQPAAEPEPFWLKDVAGDEVGVNSLPGQARISLSVDDIMWLDPDEADQLAEALRAHAAARRAESGVDA